MSTRAIREYDAKSMLSRWLAANSAFRVENFASVTPLTTVGNLPRDNVWMTATQTTRLVVKPDQLIKRRGKSGLLKLNATVDEMMKWVEERRNQEVEVEGLSGKLDHFIVEKFVTHNQSDEYYICIISVREGEEILFHHEGGVDIGHVEEKARRILVPADTQLTGDQLNELLINLPAGRKEIISDFVTALLGAYYALHSSYLEINPLVLTQDGKVHILDVAMKIDETARFECGKLWGRVDFPPPWGRPTWPEEEHIKELDGQTGASLKLTILKVDGRVWTMVAGGGASVIYSDTICDLGFGQEMANYGEYSGAPTESQTYEYANTIIKLMTRKAHPEGKILIIGGGIANFTNVAATFKGIIKALTEHSDIIRAHNIKIWVRRGGPNYQEGLESMRRLGATLDLNIHVYGPETHMTSIVAMALLGASQRDVISDGDEAGEIAYQQQQLQQQHLQNATTRGGVTFGSPQQQQQQQPLPSPTNSTASSSSLKSSNTVKFATDNDQPEQSAQNVLRRAGNSSTSSSSSSSQVKGEERQPEPKAPYNIFTSETTSFVYGLQLVAVQNMLDFDYICGRSTPSVAAMIYPFTGSHYQKLYWNTNEILVPVVASLAEATSKFPNVDVVVNFSSFRSVFETTNEIMKYPQIKTIAIIAEGVPEQRTKQLLARAKKNKVSIIGPATVGGIKPGSFRIGNTGGMLDNIIHSKLYRPGSVAYVARSGGMSNELNNIISRNSDGVYEGVAIGGDRYPGTTFVDHLLRFQANPNAKIMVVLGEVGGVEEYEICSLVERGILTKPMIAWCIGTCAKMFPYSVQFGHAGACAHGQLETADAKNAALKKCGVVVPESFEGLPAAIRQVYLSLLEKGEIKPRAEVPAPVVPVDYDWARKLGLIRKPSAFVSSIVDERGDELIYGGMKISEIFQTTLGVGGVLGLIWFRKRLPDYFCRFIEMVLMLTADHGPAVSGAHNTIVATRAGKDLVSSLCSGLLTVGPRFGGALDGAAEKFSWAYDSRMSAEDFVEAMRKKKELIPGIGHKVKSLENPDSRVVVIKSFVKRHFKSHEVFDFALEVEKVCTKKKSNLILNVDGAIAAAFVDLLRSSEVFTLEEAKSYVSMGTLNGLFVLGRSIGFIGHYIDQNRLKQGLYRHPTEDISYLLNHNLDLMSGSASQPEM